MLSDIHTLVIPTFNRAALLRRLVSYYQEQVDAPNLLVLDSSRTEIAADNAKALTSYGPRVRHVIFPDDTPMASKLAKGLEQVSTRYTSFCADDDIVFCEGMKRAIAWLENHAEHVSAHGRYINFRPKRRNVRVWVEYAGPGNEAGRAGARIFRLFQRYESLFYGMFRTADLREIFGGVAALPTLHFQELFQSVAALIKGKVHRFNAIYAARQSGPAAEPDRSRWQTFYWFADDAKELLEHYVEYRARLWAFYQTHANEPPLSDDDFRRAMDLAHAVYFAENCPPKYFYARLQHLWPDDPWRDPNKPGLLEWQVLETYPPRGGIGQWLRMPYHAMRSMLGRRRMLILREEIAELYGGRWRFRLPVNLKALASDSGFRDAALELCQYLDTN